MRKIQRFKILVINPGSTSTKISVFENEKELFKNTIHHSKLELEPFKRVWDQYEFRKKLIKELLENHNINPKSLSAVVGRGGLFRPVVSGTYRVNELMIEDGRKAYGGEHPANLGAVLAFGIGWDYHIPSFIVDPPSVDEFDEIARYTGLPDIPKKSIFHALNVKATARLAAFDLGKKHDEVNLIVAHLGGGVTVSAMRKGRVIDANNALDTGPFTPERAGTLPTLDLAQLCFSGKYTSEQIKKKMVGQGGLVAYLGTNNCEEVEKRISEGDKKAEIIYEAMLYQIAQEIGSKAVALKGELDAIVLTGGMAGSEMVQKKLKERVGFLGKIMVYPGEDEMKSLALGALRVLRGEEDAKTYPESVK
ncbi:MAG: butyrate kinase [candidate division Zixibacteria bacterium SM23_73_2]|nr:MAG: butyrate kinase [candidate division Zixibacteria bacterium SM23_73_2]